MSAWQPIETVPKDDTEVDLWCKKWRPGGEFIYKRFAEYHWVANPPHWTAYPREKSSSLSEWEATHWMPLPDPPKDADA